MRALTLAHLQLVLDTSPHLSGEQAEDRELRRAALLLDPIDELRKEVYQGAVSVGLVSGLLDARLSLFDEPREVFVDVTSQDKLLACQMREHFLCNFVDLGDVSTVLKCLDEHQSLVGPLEEYALVNGLVELLVAVSEQT